MGVSTSLWFISDGADGDCHSIGIYVVASFFLNYVKGEPKLFPNLVFFLALANKECLCREDETWRLYSTNTVSDSTVVVVGVHSFSLLAS